MSKKVKIFAIVALILAGIIGAAAYFGSTSSSTPTPSSDNPLSSSAAKAGGVAMAPQSSAPSEFSSLLSTIKNINIDTSFFSDPGYRALRDYPITLGTDTKGRPNPFAPVGYDSGSISGGSTPITKVQFETIQPSTVTSTTAQFGAQALVSDTSNASVVFEYGTNDVLGTATAPVSLSSNGTALVRVTNLIPGTTYYVRATLVQGSTTTPGNMMTFATSPKP